MSLNPSTPTETTSASDSHKTGSTLHTGHSLEAGVLARMRSWVDVFGWIRLGRVLRVAGSPTLFLLVAVTTCLWLLGLRVIDETAIDDWLSSLSIHVQDNGFVSRRLSDSLGVTQVLHAMFLPEVFVQTSTQSTLTLLFRSLWSIAVWAPCSMVLVRQGALLTAGRSMQPLGEVSRWALRRVRNAYLAALIPSVCVLSIIWMVPVIYWFSSLLGWTFLDRLLSGLLVCLALPLGILAFGSLVAVPLSWAAVINERDPDTLDSLSRGYEYLYRRPLSLFGYLVVSIVIIAAVNLLVTGIVELGTRMVVIEQPANVLSQTTFSLLTFVPLIVTYTVSWSLIGGIYLLLRQDAGGQEVEDLWIESSQPSPALPQLNTPSDKHE